jgi:acetyl esterase/lipase
MRQIAVVVVLALLIIGGVPARAAGDGLTALKDGGRPVPAHVVPLPAGISPFMRGVLEWPIDPVAPHDAAGWLADQAKTAQPEPHLRETLAGLHLTLARSVLGGVTVFLVTPTHVPAAHAGRVIDVIHGGGYVSYGGVGGLAEAILTAFFTQTPVLAVDYRMPPKAPYPAPVDDSVAAYTGLLRTHDAAHIAMVGTSAGGGLTMLTVLRLHALRRPLPAVVSLGSPWTDLTETGDTFATNRYVDSVLGFYHGWIAGAAHQFAGTRDLRDPAVSPIYAPVGAWFPPTIVTSGTRDLFLSLSVRTYRKLVDAGVDARLEVYEGMPHAFWVLASNTSNVPEVQSANRAIARFIDRHMPAER